MIYNPNWQSIKQHQTPAWFHDAKLGIIIHWCPSAVPAWAPTGGNLHELAQKNGFEYYFANNPYSEWYANSIKIGIEAGFHLVLDLF